MFGWVRDLCTCTIDELLDRWDSRQRAMVNRYDPVGFDERLVDHNPIYYVALRYWFDNDLSLLHAPLHRDRICTELLEHYLDKEHTYSGLAIYVQRESFKSTFCHGAFPHFIALRGKHILCRDERIALIHHKEPQASANLERLKLKAVNHATFKADWPEFSVEKDFGTKTAFNWPCKVEGGYVSEPSVTAAGLGARLTGFHFDWMLYSDPVTEEHIKSKVVRDEAFGKYQASRFMLDTLRGKEVIDGTFYHVNDMHSKIVKAHDDKGRKLYRSVVIGAGGPDVEEPLSMPNRHTVEFLARRRQEEIARSGNDFLYWLQYQLKPKASQLIATDPSWLQRCAVREVPDDAWKCVIVDPAWKGGHNAGKGDWAAGGVWAFERRGVLIIRYLMDGFHSNEMTALDGESAIFRLMRKWSITDVCVEEHGGYTFRGQLEKTATDRGIYLNLIDPKSKQTNKQERIVAFLRHVQAGNFRLCNDLPEALERGFMDQYNDFPQLDHDDVMDMCGYSADDAVADYVAPVQDNHFGRKPPWWAQEHRKPQSPRRTRYSGF